MSKHSVYWKRAIEEELEALDKNNTWEFTTLPNNKKAISSKWVFKIKRNPDGSVAKYKAQLCAKGCQQRRGIDYLDIFSPTTRYDTIRVLLAIATERDYEIMLFDIKTAFLYGDLEDDFYLEVPEGVSTNNQNFVCKLKKSLYGLKQAPRSWNHKFDSFLKNFGFIQSAADNCVYCGTVNNTKILLVIYVDDGLIISDSKKIINYVLTEMKKIFEITISEANYFVGLEIIRDRQDKSIFVHQSSYIKQIIKRFGFEDANPIKIPADPNTNLTSEMSNVLDENVVPYRQAVGSLIFAGIVSRPDIMYAVGVVSRFLTKHSLAHWNAVKRIFKYLKTTPHFGTKYKKGDTPLLVGFSDSDFASDIITRRSTTGYVIKIGNGVVTWASQRQHSVSLSTTEAEYVAAAQVTKEILWLQYLLEDIGEELNKPRVLYIDNQSAIKLIRNPEFHKHSKHISIRYHFVREQGRNGEIKPTYLASSEQTADILTKPLPRVSFEKFRWKMGMENC